jgi:hypothetical protein
MSLESNAPTIGDDILRGAKAIGKEIGETPSQVYYGHKTGRVPTFCEGATVCARKSRLREHYPQLERERAEKVAALRRGGVA